MRREFFSSRSTADSSSRTQLLTAEIILAHMHNNCQELSAVDIRKPLDCQSQPALRSGGSCDHEAPTVGESQDRRGRGLVPWFHCRNARPGFGQGHKCFCIETCFAFLACSVSLSSFRGLPQDMAVPSRCPRRESPDKNKLKK